MAIISKKKQQQQQQQQKKEKGKLNEIMRHRHLKEVSLSVKLSSSRAVKTCGTSSSGAQPLFRVKYLFGEAKIA